MTKKSWLSLVIGFSCLLTTMPSVAELVLTPCDGRVISDLKFVINDQVIGEEWLIAPSIYEVGEYLEVKLQEDLRVCSRYESVDLWVALEMPDGTRLFMVRSSFPPFFSFSISPAPLKYDLNSSSNEKLSILSMKVPAGMGGQYDFYAAYTKAASNINELLFTSRSNIAAARVILAND
jgi:hypothetical protein